MPDRPNEHYENREHSWVKHQFLTEYLKAAAFKTLQGRSSVFNYIDGFAGPWAVADEDNYSDSSFDQAIRTLLAVKETLEAHGKQRYVIRFCLCEKDPLRVQQLRRYAEAQASLNIHVFEGSFESHLDEIASICARGFSFTFIDPTGFNLGSLEIAAFLARLRGEFLLNFMSEHINRYPTVESVQSTFGRLLADTDWRASFDALADHLPNEMRVLVLLKERLKQLRAGRYMPDFGILNARRKRRQMRLVLGTNSTAGVEFSGTFKRESSGCSSRCGTTSKARAKSLSFRWPKSGSRRAASGAPRIVQ